MQQKTTRATMGAFDAKTHFSDVLKRVEGGEHIEITRHGKPIAKIVPIHDAERDTALRAVESLRAMRSRVGSCSIDEIIGMAHEGHSH